MATARKTAPRPSPAPSHPPVPAGILDGNGRTARLARWLRELPRRKEVDTLVLEMKSEDGWQRVQSWDRADAGMHLALPIDVVPDLIPIAGQLDDAILVALVLRWFVGSGQRAHIEALWPGPPESLRLLLRLAGGAVGAPPPRSRRSSD